MSGEKAVRCPNCGNLHVSQADVDECVQHGALVKAGVPQDKIDAIFDLERMKTEELNPDLEEYVYEEGFFGTCLKHPLVFQIPFTLPGLANRAYAQKQSLLDDALEKQDWSTAIWLHERPYRLEALIDYVVGRDDLGKAIPLVVCRDKAKQLAADVWVDSENIHQNLEDWECLFSEWDCGDDMLFNDDPEGWAKLPDTLTVYRAGIDDGGWSWTLDPKVAEFFAKRFGENHVMSVGHVKKECIFGYLTRRSEAEVLVPDDTVTDQRPYAGTVGGT